MKRILALFLSAALMLSGCTPAAKDNMASALNTEAASTTVTAEVETYNDTEAETPAEPVSEQESANNLHFKGLGDAELLSYVEENVYAGLVGALDSDDYLIENIQAVYLSDEYIEDLQYNSKENVFFGYTISELDRLFQGQRYIFTLGEDCQTTVVPLVELYDDTYDRVLKNVAIGTGVILVCVTVSLVAAPAAPAVSMIFATAAATGTTYALESGGIAFIAAAVARGYQTQDFDEAMKAGTLAGSEGFKWGAIIGASTGGVKEVIGLKGATLNGLTMNEAAEIQRASHWPLAAIKSIHSVEEYNIYKAANLIPTKMADGSWLLIREIDWTALDSFGRTNAQRVLNGLAPLDATGKPFELHHIGQKADSPLAILTWSEHHSGGNFSVLHYADEGKNVADSVWSSQKKEVWSAFLSKVMGTIS